MVFTLLYYWQTGIFSIAQASCNGTTQECIELMTATHSFTKVEPVCRPGARFYTAVFVEVIGTPELGEGILNIVLLHSAILIDERSESAVWKCCLVILKSQTVICRKHFN